MHEFQFYEDDVGMIQILPIANWRYCERELVAIAKHSEEHLAPGGAGWTEMYKLSDDEESLEDAVSIRSLDITEARFIELLAPCGRKFDRLVSPLSEIDAALGIRSVGFGPSRQRGIVADLEDEYVRSIWCKLPRHKTDENAELADMLSALSQDHHLLLVDWADLRVVDLRSKSAVEDYLNGDG